MKLFFLSHIRAHKIQSNLYKSIHQFEFNYKENFIIQKKKNKIYLSLCIFFIEIRGEDRPLIEHSTV